MRIKSGKLPMKNITVYLPYFYDEIIQKLILLKIIESRSEFIRIALKEFFENENEDLKLMMVFKNGV